MSTNIEALIERVLLRHCGTPLSRRAEIRRVLNRHRGSKTIVAGAVRPRPVTVQAVAQWLSGRLVSQRIWKAADAIAKELIEQETAARTMSVRQRSRRSSRAAGVSE